jgi:hypothetical protein
MHINAISIDRRKHLEMAWQRQQQQESQATALQGRLQSRTVLEVKNLPELDSMAELIGSNILVVFFYSRVRTVPCCPVHTPSCDAECVAPLRRAVAVASRSWPALRVSAIRQVKLVFLSLVRPRPTLHHDSRCARL